jgi:hypothetical protein
MFLRRLYRIRNNFKQMFFWFSDLPKPSFSINSMKLKCSDPYFQSILHIKVDSLENFGIESYPCGIKYFEKFPFLNLFARRQYNLNKIDSIFPDTKLGKSEKGMCSCSIST